MDNIYNFQKLTPTDNVDIKVYEKALEFVFSNNDLTNIAISGPYSAGKSSVIETYKKENDHIKFMHLSLAHFREIDDNTRLKSTTEPEKVELSTNNVIEGKLLNQLIHQISPDKIPQTNFKIKRKDNSINSRRLTAMILSFLLSVIILFNASSIVTFCEKTMLWSNVALRAYFEPYFVFVAAFLIFVTCAAVGINSIIKLQQTKNLFKKLNLQGNEIEIFETQDESYFDKYLNEVLYLFENVQEDVIVFEDMDRFDASTIFERLHEINTLVNMKRKTPLRFFYLLRDDIFESKDRTKFFDFIIPIIPVVDASNSYQQFKKLFEVGGILSDFDQSFLNGLSLYIDDMRILKNIYNEYIIYFKRLNVTRLNSNKMLAIIAYKNIFPKDFAELQLKKGFVFELFRQKKALIIQEIEETNKEVEIVEQRIQAIKDIIVDSKHAIELLYNEKIESSKNRLTYYNRTTIEAEIQGFKDELKLKKQAIDDKENNRLPDLESELIRLKHKLLHLESMSLSDLLSRNNVDEYFNITHESVIGSITNFNDIKTNDYFSLLKYLIRYGYIDETYRDYLTYFYEGGICANDKIFLRRITDKQGADYLYPLKEPEKVVEAPVVREYEFEQAETLNFDLLKYMLSNISNEKYQRYVKILILQLKEEGNFDFIAQYYDSDKTVVRFVIELNTHWIDFFNLIVSDLLLSEAQVRRFSIDTLQYCNSELIQQINIDGCLTDYISNSSDYLKISQPQIEKIVAEFVALNVCFESIDYDSANQELFDEVYKNNLYILNFSNIVLMINKKLEIVDDYKIRHMNYTIIGSDSSTPLALYIEGNINDYLALILENCDGSINDDETAAIKIMNNKEIDIHLKQKYVSYLATTIHDLTTIDNSELWHLLIEHNILDFSTNNFINYYIAFETIDAHLIKFINEHTSNVDFTDALDNFDEDTIISLCNDIVNCNDIENSKYKKLLCDMDFIYENYDADQISDDKIDILIAEHRIVMNEYSLKYIREYYEGHTILFIKSNFPDYLSILGEIDISHDEILKCLVWDGADEEQKLQLLAYTSEPIKIIDQGYSDNINAYIIANNISTEEKAEIYKSFSDYGSQSQDAILDLAMSDMSYIFTNKIQIDDELLSLMFQSSKLTIQQKNSLFDISLQYFDEDKCQKHFVELDVECLNGIFKHSGGRRKYDRTTQTTAVLQILKTHGWIYDFTVDDLNSEKYLVYKNPPKTQTQ